MCFTCRAKKGKRIRSNSDTRKRIKSVKIHPEPTPTFTMDENIRCQGCFQRFLFRSDKN